VVLHWRLHALAMAWASWRAAMSERRAALQLAAAAVFTYVGSLKRKAFICWRTAAAARAAMRRRALGVLSWCVLTLIQDWCGGAG
jgi:hypothetical protein